MGRGGQGSRRYSRGGSRWRPTPVVKAPAVLAATATVVFVLGGAGVTGTIGASAAGATGAVTAPVPPIPPVSSADFPTEPVGQAPVDGDGLIPDPQTPTGVAPGGPSICTVVFDSAAGATSATVNAWIAGNENDLTGPAVVCLAGTFTDPLHVWSKTSTALLEVAPEPGRSATLALGTVQAQDTDANQYWSDSGGVSIIDSRSVEVEGLTVEGYTFDGTAHDPAGIYVTARADKSRTNQTEVPHRSACYLNGNTCGDIYLIDDTVTDITNTADEDHTDRSVCNKGDVGAYGIAVIGAGKPTGPSLEHVVIEGDAVSGTRTGQSETVTVNGAVRDFLVADNVVENADNIGIDTIGWETGRVQAAHGIVEGNTVADVDTESNAAYGKWHASTATCAPLPENAAGIYDDGASTIWIVDNTVWNSDQGINLDVETARHETDHLLVTGNTVHQDPGTSPGDPSTGTEPPGVGGTSTVAGHDPYALYVDAFGKGSTIEDVAVIDNSFQNESQEYLQPSWGMPVVDLGGRWTDVEIWHDTISGLGPTDRDNPLLEIETPPLAGGTDTIDCNDFEQLSSAADTVGGNFSVSTTNWLTLAGWQAGNGHGWDADSAVGGFSPACPAPAP